jgi:hypothetical protein
MSYNSSSSFSTSGATDSNGDSDYLYYNALIINNKSDNPINWNADPPATFTDVRAKPLINNVSNFDFSIMRFDMNGSGKKLPLFIPEIETQLSRNPTKDVKQTVYTIGATVNFKYLASPSINPATGLPFSGTQTIYRSRNIIFEPENEDAPIPRTIPYPYGSQFVNTVLPQNGETYQYNNLTYRCSNQPQPVDCLSNTWNSSITYNVGDIEWNGTILAICILQSTGFILTNATYWTQIPLFSTGAPAVLPNPPYAPNNYVYYSNNINIVYQKNSTILKNYFESATAYIVGNQVSYLGSIYECIQASTAPFPVPTNTSYWTLVESYLPTNTKYWTIINEYLNPLSDTTNFSYIPQATAFEQDLTSNYYYLSSYRSFILMINKQLDLYDT